MKIIFDVYPMLNSYYTGIPQTTWNISKYILNNKIDCIFTIGYRILQENEIKHLIEERSGRKVYEKFIINIRKLINKHLSSEDFKQRIYFSPHVLSCINVGGLATVRIIHDLSSMTMKQFHAKDTVKKDGINLATDIYNCDLIFTVSNSSKDEIINYFGINSKDIVVSYPGVEWTKTQIRYCSTFLFKNPYVLILATDEPRKNLALVFKYLISNINKILNENVIYVFTGHKGWGENILLEYKKDLNELCSRGKIVFTGFIPEEMKMSLMSGAKYLIFPSYFEGFGSPVAEALSLGTPVLCSFGGSLTEVGGEAAYYFSPFSLKSLTDAIQRLEYDLYTDFYSVKLKSKIQGEKFTWEKFNKIIFNHLEQLYDIKNSTQKFGNSW